MVQNRGVLDKLENEHIKDGGSNLCPAKDTLQGSHGADTSIKFAQVSGLWYILCMAVGTSAALTVASNAHHRWKKKRRPALADGAGGRGGGDGGRSLHDTRSNSSNNRFSMLKRFVGLSPTSDGASFRIRSPRVSGLGGWPSAHGVHGAGLSANAAPAAPGIVGGSGTSVAKPGGLAEQQSSTGKAAVGMDEVLELSHDGAWGRGIAALKGHGDEDPDEVLRLSAAGLLPGQPRS